MSPTVSVFAGALTENGTWLAAIAHQGSYAKDRVLYLGFLGYVAPKMAVYFGPDDILEGKFDFEMSGFATMQEVLYRIYKEVLFFLGQKQKILESLMK